MVSLLLLLLKKSDNSIRTMNGKYHGKDDLGYLKIVDNSDKTIKNVNTRTLMEVKMNRVEYKINK